MERVSIKKGKSPIIVIAPHGCDCDDQNTALIAETIANRSNAYAVINRGFERNDAVDVMKDKADCNNVSHCHEDVVKEEFLDPIIKFKTQILQTHDVAYVYWIHGMGNKHRKIAKNPNLDIVIGYGAGSPSSYSCDLWRKNAFIDMLRSCGIIAYQGDKGSSMSGWSKNNMNQLFRKWYPDNQVQSMQLEIIQDLRKDEDSAMLIAEYLAMQMQDMLTVDSFTKTIHITSY